MQHPFKNLGELSHEHLRDIAMLCGSVALLLLVVGFITIGGFSGINNTLARIGIGESSQTACVLGICLPNNNTSFSDTGLYFAPGQSSTVSPGASVQWVWNAGTYGANTFSEACIGQQNGADYVCKLGLSVPSWPTNCSAATYIIDDTGFVTGVTPGTGDCGNVDGSNAYATPGYPTLPGNFDGYYGTSGGNTPVGQGYPGGHITLTAPTTPGTYTYYMCSYFISRKYGSAYGCASNELTVAVPVGGATPTTLTSFTATPSTIVVGGSSNLAWTGTKGTNFSACELIDDFGHAWWYSALPGNDSSGALTTPGAYGFYMNCFDTTGVSTGWKNAGVNVTAPPSCPNGLDIAAYPSCTCTGATHQSGSSCVADTCANGLDIAAYPSCTCPVGKTQSGSTCVIPDICSDISGSQQSVPPGCNNPTPPPTGSCIPSGGSYNGFQCKCPQYAPLTNGVCQAPAYCPNGLTYATYGPTCQCPAGQEQVSGSHSCIDAGAINSFTATPNRVQKGSTTSLAWSTSHMASCSVSELATTGLTNLSSALSNTLTPVINGQTVFTLGCTDNAGVSVSASVTVNIIPTVIEQ